LVITATTSAEGAQLFLAPIARFQERQPLGEFEGSVQVHEVFYRERGPTLFLTETIRRDRHVFSSGDPQRLWLVDSQEKREVLPPAGLTNWFVGKGGISPDGRFVALLSWHKQGRQPGTRVVHVGDVQKGGWRTVELAGTSLELVGWEGAIPKGVVLTGDRYDKSAVQKTYALDPGTGQLSPLEAVPARFNSKVLSSPSQRRTVEVQEKQGLVIADAAGGRSQVFTFHPADRRSLVSDSVRWGSDRYLVFQGPRTALIDAETLKMSFPVTRESGFNSLEFSADFKHALGGKKDGQYLGEVSLPEQSKPAE
jgi:hypothetical protein